jgi:hypothetical protein
MGCGSSNSTGKPAEGKQPAPGIKSETDPHKGGAKKNTTASSESGKGAGKGAANATPAAAHGTAPPTTYSGGEEKKLNGKDKYLMEVGGVVCEVEDRRRTTLHQCYVVVYGTLTGVGFTVIPTTAASTTSGPCEYFFSKEYTDDALRETKEQQRVTHTWAAFFKSLSSEVSKAKVKVSANLAGSSAVAQEVRLEFSITSSKDPKATQPFSVALPQKPRTQFASVAAFVLEPIVMYVQKRRGEGASAEGGSVNTTMETDLIVKAASLNANKRTVEGVMPELRPLREEATNAAKVCTESQTKVSSLERRLRRLKAPAGRERHSLDVVYEEGGAVPFQHVAYADEHVPKEQAPNEEVLALIRERLPIAEGGDVANAFLSRTPSGKIPEEASRLFSRLDQWDFNVFELDQLTNNMSLFHVTYALLYRWNLVSTLSLDDKVVRKFLQGVQSGYHPNPYHNASHAADVTQITSFIIGAGGLMKSCNLQTEDLLGAILAACIHDYDHPGFNNNFHTRTGAYLSTLYNDRSILENHHLACIFEMTRIPRYDIFAPLGADRRKEVRDTMIEMVLSTDMGNHAKIFSQFRKRLSESSDWSQRMEDRRLALSMAIKMADISNCGRPRNLYSEWARNIANEFYNQGDVEARLKLPISPFMDRRKDKTDFRKGQISFMNYIVVPMFDAIVEFLPSLEFVLQYCAANKEYWQTKDG